MNVTLRQLEMFIAIADQASFSRAAARLRVTQPVLSNAIRDLEGSLGIKLFDRTTRRVELTQAGREFRMSAERVVADLGNAVRNLQALAARDRGYLVVAAPPLLAAALLPQAIAEYKAANSGVVVNLIDVPTDQIVRKVRAREAECGVGTFAPDEDGIQRKLLARDSLMLFCSPKSSFANISRVSWRDLGGQPLVALTCDSSVRLLVDAALLASSVQTQIAFEVSHMTTAIMLVEAGLGIAILPTYAWTFARDRDVVAKPLHDPVVSREISMIQALDHPLSLQQKRFYLFCKSTPCLQFPEWSAATS